MISPNWGSGRQNNKSNQRAAGSKNAKHTDSKPRKQSGNNSDFNDVIQNFENMPNTSCYQDEQEPIDEILMADSPKKYCEEPKFNAQNHKFQKSKSLRFLGKRTVPNAYDKGKS